MKRLGLDGGRGWVVDTPEGNGPEKKKDPQCVIGCNKF